MNHLAHAAAQITLDVAALLTKYNTSSRHIDCALCIKQTLDDLEAMMNGLWLVLAEFDGTQEDNHAAH